MPWNHCPIPPVVRNLLGPLRILRVPLLLWQDPCETESRTSEGNFTDDIFLCRDHNFAWESLSHTPSGPNAFGTLTALSGPLLLCRTPVQPNPEPLKDTFTDGIFLCTTGNHCPSHPVVPTLLGPLRLFRSLCFSGRTPVQPNPGTFAGKFADGIFLCRPQLRSEIIVPHINWSQRVWDLYDSLAPLLLWQDPRATESRNL